MNTFLSPEEVTELTGYVRKSEQCRELARMGIQCYVNHLGIPKVPRDALLQAKRVPTGAQNGMPDLEALETLSHGP